MNDISVSEIQSLILRCHEIMAEVEKQKERNSLIDKLNILCHQQLDRINIDSTILLLALLDAYEVTRDEGMLQEVLDVVSGNLERLEVSADGVKLLAYCYYYVEEEECAMRAREMLKELKRMGESGDEIAEAEKVLEELSGL